MIATQLTHVDRRMGIFQQQFVYPDAAVHKTASGGGGGGGGGVSIFVFTGGG
jgi:hypothetical protein